MLWLGGLGKFAAAFFFYAVIHLLYIPQAKGSELISGSGHDHSVKFRRSWDGYYKRSPQTDSEQSSADAVSTPAPDPGPSLSTTATESTSVTDTALASTSTVGTTLPTTSTGLTVTGTTTSASTTTAPTSTSPVATSSFWLENIKHQGISPFNPDVESYNVFRNVKDYGAVGDGVHDDTEAINLAISSQNRCGLATNCKSSTLSPAIVYFPQGTYLITTPIIPYYYTQLIGDATNPPTILADPTFDGLAMIDANPYTAFGQYFIGTTNFHRSIRNFIIDTRQVPPERSQGTGIHWQVAQSTSLINIVFQLSDDPATTHQGIWMEDGSGGFMGDLVINGGKTAIWAGNQQFTVRNVTVNNAQTGIFNLWGWSWTYQSVKFNNCTVGFDITTGGQKSGGQTMGAVAIIDSVVKDTPIFVRTSQPSNGSLDGSLVINNADLTNVPNAVAVLNGPTVLPGTTSHQIIASWVQGNVYRGSNGQGVFTQDNTQAPVKGSSLLDPTGRIVSRGHPQYEDRSVTDFVSARDEGAVGDGVTDDTRALQAMFNKYAGQKIIFLDAGFYIVSSTITIPAGTRLVGEAWSVLAGKGPAFQNPLNPQVVFRVGNKGSQGVMEITDVVFTTVGPAPGAIVVEWNIREPSGFQAGAGMWDTHIRLAGSQGTDLQVSNCPTVGTGIFSSCYAAFMSLHITQSATGYFEGTWVWLADHDLDDPAQGQVTVYAGRGVLSESKGPVWMIGTASEHHVLYQYNLVGAQDHYLGLIQTETPYFQPQPPTPFPFLPLPTYGDPTPYSASASAWALSVQHSQRVIVFGAGLYSLFSNYNSSCLGTQNCQTQLVNIDSSDVQIYSLSTIATTYQLSIGGQGVINAANNLNGFAPTVSSWGP